MEECLNSILKIKNIDYEVLIINDGSTDNSQKIIEEFCSKNKKIKFFIKKNGGLSSARNLGIEKSKGEYIWFVDSDDFIDAEKFEEFFQITIKNKLDVCCGNYIYYDNIKKDFFNNENNLLETEIISGEEYIKKQKDRIFLNVVVWTRVYRTDFLKSKKLFFKEKIVFEDCEFLVPSLLEAKRIKIVDISFYFYRINRSGSITDFVKSSNKNFSQNLKEAKAYLAISKKLLECSKKINEDFFKKKTIIFYLDSLERSKIRDINYEKEMYKTIEGIRFFKYKMRFKIWRKTYLHKKYKVVKFKIKGVRSEI